MKAELGQMTTIKTTTSAILMSYGSFKSISAQKKKHSRCWVGFKGSECDALSKKIYEIKRFTCVRL